MGIALVAMGEELGKDMAQRSMEHLLQYGDPFVRCAARITWKALVPFNMATVKLLQGSPRHCTFCRLLDVRSGQGRPLAYTEATAYADCSVKLLRRRAVPLAVVLLNTSNPSMGVMDMLSRLSHDSDVDVGANAVLAMGAFCATPCVFHNRACPPWTCYRASATTLSGADGVITLSASAQPADTLLYRMGHGLLPKQCSEMFPSSTFSGIIGAGTNNARLAGLLRSLSAYYAKEPQLLFLVRVAQGLVHMGKGLLTLAPHHAHGQLLAGAGRHVVIHLDPTLGSLLVNILPEAFPAAPKASYCPVRRKR